MKILFYLGALAIAVLILLVIFTRKKDADPFREIKIAHIESEKRLVPIFQRLLIQEFPEFQSDFTEARCSIALDRDTQNLIDGKKDDIANAQKHNRHDEGTYLIHGKYLSEHIAPIFSERFAEYAKDDPASFAKSYEAAYYTALKMN